MQHFRLSLDANPKSGLCPGPHPDASTTSRNTRQSCAHGPKSDCYSSCACPDPWPGTSATYRTPVRGLGRVLHLQSGVWLTAQVACVLIRGLERVPPAAPRSVALGGHGVRDPKSGLPFKPRLSRSVAWNKRNLPDPGPWPTALAVRGVLIRGRERVPPAAPRSGTAFAIRSLACHSSRA